jgi:AAA domain
VSIPAQGRRAEVGENLVVEQHPVGAPGPRLEVCRGSEPALRPFGEARALGLEVSKRPVLYLALEDGHRRLQDRCRRLLAGDPIPSEFQYLTMIEPGRVNDTITAWIHLHQDPPPLVILDTLGKILPPTQPGEDRYQRDYRIGTALKRIVDGLPGMTLLVNHHDRKANADDFVDAVSGTHGRGRRRRHHHRAGP